MNSRNYKFVTLAILVFLFFNLKATAQVGIGTTTPNANAMLDVVSTDKGFLPPRMTTAEKDLISLTLPEETGMLVFDTTLGAYSFWDGTAWVAIGGAVASSNSYGSLYSTSGGSTTSTTPTGVKINGSSTADHLQDFTSAVNNRLVYTGSDTKVFTVHLTMALTRLTNTGITDTLFFYVSKNGVAVGSVFNTFSLPAVTDPLQTYNVTIIGTVELATGDYIEPYAIGFFSSDINVINLNLVLTD